MDSETVIFPVPATGTNPAPATELRALRTYPWKPALAAVLSRYTMGFELECQVLHEALETRARQLRVPYDWTGAYHCDCRNGILAAYDSTITQGNNGLSAREIKSQVLREADAPLASRILHLFEFLGCTGGLTTAGQSGSFHLHLRPVGGWRDEDVNVMLRVWRDTAQPLMAQAAGRSRTDPSVGGRWAAPVSDNLRWCRAEKYQQVSVRQMRRGRGTVEFRVYHATWSATEITSWIQACTAICDAVISARQPQHQPRNQPDSGQVADTRYRCCRHDVPLLVASNFRDPPDVYDRDSLTTHSPVYLVGRQREPWNPRGILTPLDQLSELERNPSSIRGLVTRLLHMEYQQRNSRERFAGFGFNLMTMTHIVSLLRLRIGRTNRGGSPAVNWRGVERALLGMVADGWPLMRTQAGCWVFLPRWMCLELMKHAVPDNAPQPIDREPTAYLRDSRTWLENNAPSIPMLTVLAAEWHYEPVVEVLEAGIPGSAVAARAPTTGPARTRAAETAAIRTALEKHIADFRPRNRLQALRDYQRANSPRICQQLGLQVPRWIAATARRRTAQRAA